MKKNNNFFDYLRTAESLSHSIPPILHFIWAGGTKIMVPDCRMSVCNWARSIAKNLELYPNLKKDFRLYLWVDVNEETLPYLKEYFDSEIPYNFLLYKNFLVLRDITYEFDLCADQMENWEGQYLDARTKNKAPPRLCSPYVRYEIDRCRPNFGCSSDILRCRIGYFYGGVYFDSDVEPGESCILELINTYQGVKSPIFKVADNSQNEQVVGNDNYVVSPFHPIMMTLLDEAEKRYHPDHSMYHMTESFEISQLANDGDYLAMHMMCLYDNFAYISRQTLFKTGPRLWWQILKTFECFSSVKPKLVLEKAHLLESIYYKPFTQNTLGWLAQCCKIQDNSQNAINMIRQNILFEAQTLNMLRFDDHVNNFLEMTCNEDREAAQRTILTLLHEELLTLKTAGICYLDLSSSCREFFGFCLEAEIEIEIASKNSIQTCINNIEMMMEFLMDHYEAQFKNLISDITQKSEHENISQFRHEYFLKISLYVSRYLIAAKKQLVPDDERLALLKQLSGTVHKAIKVVQKKHERIEVYLQQSHNSEDKSSRTSGNGCIIC